MHPWFLRKRGSITVRATFFANLAGKNFGPFVVVLSVNKCFSELSSFQTVRPFWWLSRTKIFRISSLAKIFRWHPNYPQRRIACSHYENPPWREHGFALDFHFPTLWFIRKSIRTYIRVYASAFCCCTLGGVEEWYLKTETHMKHVSLTSAHYMNKR